MPTIEGVYGNHIYGYDVNGFSSQATLVRIEMPEKVMFLSTRLSDKATVTGSSEIGTLPAVNVLDQEPSKVWRTEASTAQYIDFVMPSASVLNAAAVIWPPGALSSAAQGKLELYAALADVGVNAPVVDSGWVSLWPSSFKHNDPNWGPECGLIRVTNTSAYRYARLHLTDPGVNTLYLDIARIAIGTAVQFKINPKFDGGIGYVPIDIQEANGYGQVFTDPRPYQQRIFELVWSSLANTEVMQDATELTRQRSQSGDFFVFLDPGEIDDFHRKSMQALFEGSHKFTPQAIYVQDKDGQMRQGWGFTLTMIQKL